ncbi:MAG: hypothetical protein H6618_07450 [Deltaproteobacteria bacterium]|nr:hypothetical protein [Deltaproteobacteria bacterium]
MPRTSHVSDQEFIMSCLHRYLNGDMASDESQRFHALMQQSAYSKSVKDYQEKTGLLQLKFQDIRLNEAERISIQNKISDADTIMTLEKVRISELSSEVKASDLYRKAILLTIIAVVVWGGYTLLKPQSSGIMFDPLNALTYEALAMEEDSSGERLYMPSSDPDEIIHYLKSTPGLNFSPGILAPSPIGWSIEGSSVIDYEILKISVVQYKSEQRHERMFFFNLPGNLKDLPESRQGTSGTFHYQPYASDKINLIAWQHKAETLAVLIGHQSIQDLVKIAESSSELPSD